MSGFFIGIGETVQKRQSDNLELSENSELPVRSILGSELSFFCPVHTFSIKHGIMLGRQDVKCVFQLMRLTKC